MDRRNGSAGGPQAVARGNLRRGSLGKEQLTTGENRNPRSYVSQQGGNKIVSNSHHGGKGVVGGVIRAILSIQSGGGEVEV